MFNSLILERELSLNYSIVSYILLLLFLRPRVESLNRRVSVNKVLILILA